MIPYVYCYNLHDMLDNAVDIIIGIENQSVFNILRYNMGRDVTADGCRNTCFPRILLLCCMTWNVTLKVA